MTSLQSHSNFPNPHHMVDEIQQVATPSASDEGASDFAGVSALDSSHLSKSEGEGINLKRRRKSQITEDILHPIKPPEGHPALDFRPVMLKPSITILLAFIFLLIGLGIATILYRAGKDSHFRVTDHYMYFTAQYVPSIIGTITVLFYRSMVREFHCMTPYFSMADGPDQRRDGAIAWWSIGFRYFPDMILSEKVGPYITTLGDILGPIVAVLIVPAKASLLTTRLQSDGTWAMVLRRTPALCLICGYALMTILTVTITVSMWGRQTGLKWYPAALADQLALFRDSDTLSYFAQVERKDSLQALRRDIFEGVRFRLGYWSRRRPGSVKAEEVWYGIGVIDNSTSPLSLLGTAPPDDESTIEEKSAPSLAVLQTSDSSLHQRRALKGESSTILPVIGKSEEENSIHDLCTCGGKKCEHNPYQFGVLWMGDRAFVFWCVLIASCFVLALYIVGSGLIHTGLSVPHYTAYSNLLYAFLFTALPTWLAGMLTVYFRNVDTRQCFSQSFAGMNESSGSASNTILLEYLTGLPLLVPLNAYQNGHMKVAWFSLVNTISPIFPILIGGIITMTDTGTRMQLNFGMPSFTSSLMFLTLYGTSMFFLRPSEKRLLPRNFRRLMDLIAMCHASKFLRSPDFDISHPGTTREHMVARIFLREDKYRLGVYEGVDGKRHIGFDVVGVDGALLPENPICQSPAVDRRWWQPRRVRGSTNDVRFWRVRRSGNDVDF